MSSGGLRSCGASQLGQIPGGEGWELKDRVRNKGFTEFLQGSHEDNEQQTLCDSSAVPCVSERKQNCGTWRLLATDLGQENLRLLKQFFCSVTTSLLGSASVACDERCSLCGCAHGSKIGKVCFAFYSEKHPRNPPTLVLFNPCKIQCPIPWF